MWLLIYTLTSTVVCLTYWGRVTHICVNKLTIIGSDNDLSFDWRQAIIWTNAGKMDNWTLGNKRQWNLNRNSYISIQENVFENVVWKMAAIVMCVKVAPGFKDIDMKAWK